MTSSQSFFLTFIAVCLVEIQQMRVSIFLGLIRPGIEPIILYIPDECVHHCATKAFSCVMQCVKTIHALLLPYIDSHIIMVVLSYTF
jgi:hypothetical protein